MRERGLDRAILAVRERGTPILGICGGFQMLGRRISDPHGVESAGEMAGLGLLPFDIVFEREKVTRTVTARVMGESALWGPNDAAAWTTDVAATSVNHGASEAGAAPAHDTGSLGSSSLSAYEIHMGRLVCTEGGGGVHAFELRAADGVVGEGMISDDGLVVGSHMHGLLENAVLRTALLRRLASRRGVVLPDAAPLESVDAALDRLADSVCQYLDVGAMASASGLRLPRK